MVSSKARCLSGDDDEQRRDDEFNGNDEGRERGQRGTSPRARTREPEEENIVLSSLLRSCPDKSAVRALCSWLNVDPKAARGDEDVVECVGDKSAQRAAQWLCLVQKGSVIGHSTVHGHRPASET
ncbi:hypothetical protein B0H10DRAFT_1999860 [Mycena sp. CBHHK59/15]|nr:hypothetical protein B0H10DRAFT_1999860 [Mycena sp. CBHHK59/15]